MAPVLITGTTTTPGNISFVSDSTTPITSGRSGDGLLGVASPTNETETFGSATTWMSVSLMDSGGTPGRMRQLTLAVASCGSALFAWPRGETRGDARRAHHRVPVGHQRGQARRGVSVGRRAPNQPHVGGDLRVRFDQRRPLEVLPRDIVQLDGEFERREARERLRQVVDRVVLHRHRAVAARVDHLELEILVDLLARLHLVGQVLAFPYRAAAAFIDRQLGVDQVAVILDEPVDAVELTAFLVGGQRQNQIAARA